MRVEHDVSPLSRARLPVDTTELARYLIGKTIVRKVGRSRISGRIEMASPDLPSESLSPVSLVRKGSKRGIIANCFVDRQPDSPPRHP